MAGYICKIVIEDTHPPVWRRVVIPDKITFRELHEVIQVLFEWQNAHLHGFNILADRISIDDIEETRGRQYAEAKTRIDSFFRNYKSIRYTYDFGDEWRHKINIEKMDEEYTERYATLLKFKGDNFIEDACWDMGDESRSPFDKEAVEKQLKDMKFPAHDEIEETPLLKEIFANLKSMFEGFCKMHPELLEEMPDEFLEKINPTEEVAREVNEWKIFEMDMIENTKSVSLKLVPPTKTQKELLMGLGEKEAKDYYKYLQLPLMNSLTKKDKVNEISKTLQNYPEYLLYIFDKNQARDLADWIKFPQGIISKRPVNSGMIIKALSLGLMEFHRKGNTGEISFASDIHKFTDDLDVKTRKRVYQNLKEFDSNFAKIIQIYSLIELESLYEIYQKIYSVKIEKKEFFRYIYWHARFNSFIYTYYMADGTCYVASVEVDAEAIVNRMKKYEEQLSYDYFLLGTL